MVSEEILKRVKDADAYLNAAYNKYAHRKQIGTGSTEFTKAMDDGYNLYMEYAKYVRQNENDIPFMLKLTAKAKQCCEMSIQNRYRYHANDGKIGGRHPEKKFTVWDLIDLSDETGKKYKLLEDWYEALYIESYYLFDSYLLYLEKNRDADRRFYLPKRKQLIQHGIIQGMQDLEDDKIDRLLISMPPGTGKTTAEVFFMTWIAGKYPNDFSLFYSHSGSIDDMVYRNCLDIITSPEYTWGEIFPDVPVESTNAKKCCIDLGDYNQHATIQTTSAGASNAGQYRANRYLYVDDLIPGIEIALNADQLEKRWNLYTVDARQRKASVGHGKNAKPCKEIHIATRWAVSDVIGRLIDIYGKDGRTRVISVRATDAITGNSNFEYKINGMTKEFFEDQRKLMDEISYNCLYNQEPIEREGLLFPVKSLRRYLNLPMREPDARLAICDTKNKGSDYMAFAFLWQYGNDYYLVDALCTDSSNYALQYKRSVDMITDKNIQIARIESNQGGDRYAYEIEQRIKEIGHPCKIDTKYTLANKETKIQACASSILEKIIFPDESMYRPNSDMERFIKFLVTYSARGKNAHDDVPDCLSSFIEWQTEGNRVAKVEAMRNPFTIPVVGGYSPYGW